MTTATKNAPATPQPTYEQLLAKIAELEASQAAKNNATIVFKVAAESGAISAYGVQNRRPVTLYASQWKRTIEAATGSPLDPNCYLGQFISRNEKFLSLVPGENETQAGQDKRAVRMAEAARGNKDIQLPSKNNGN